MPISKHYLIELLCRDVGLTSAEEASSFRQLCRLIEALLHYQFHQKLEKLKQLYEAFDPDSLTLRPPELPGTSRSRLEEVLHELEHLLERANFERLSRSDIEAAMNRAGRWGVNFQVPFEALEELRLYYRHEDIELEKKSARLWGLVPEREVASPVYNEVLLIVYFRADADVPAFVDKQCLYIKLFKDTHKDDLEMLIPGVKIRIKALDKLKIGMPLLFGTLMFLGKIAFSAAVTLATGLMGLISWLGLVCAPLGYGFRSYYGYISTRQRYQLTMSQSLYYQNVANNLAAFSHLIDQAEAQEFREIILAWAFLWKHAPDRGWTSTELDRSIEEYLSRTAGLHRDFEIDDALAKLDYWGLAHADAQGRWHATPLDKGLRHLDCLWDNFFCHNN
ncbi:MAG: hypothetical protein C4297_13585 [Gemmataceae bacterium]